MHTRSYTTYFRPNQREPGFTLICITVALTSPHPNYLGAVPIHKTAFPYD